MEVTTEVKVYANKEMFATEDKGVIERYQSFVSSAPMFSDMPEFKQEYKAFCNEIREQLQINNIISFLYVEEKGVMFILTYDVFASEGLGFQQGFDETGSYMIKKIAQQQ
jgi:hypothetical protein